MTEAEASLWTRVYADEFARLQAVADKTSNRELAAMDADAAVDHLRSRARPPKPSRTVSDLVDRWDGEDAP